MTPEQRKKLEAFFDLPYETQIELTGRKKGTLASWKARFDPKGLGQGAVDEILLAMKKHKQ